MKTDETNNIERKLYFATHKIGTYGCFEVTIGSERVDYLTCDTSGIWRCYEIKVSKSDFFSPAAKTFVAHYNYYVMPDSLYEQVKSFIPNYVGVHNGSIVIKKAVKTPLKVDENLLMSSMIRSLYRDADKLQKTEDGKTLDRLKREIKQAQNEIRKCNHKYNRLYCLLVKKYGPREAKKLIVEEDLFDE